MSHKLSAIVIVEPEYAPGRLVIFRLDTPHGEKYVWCGRSIGWRPLNYTATMFFQLFRTMEDAALAADKYITFPLMEKL